MKNMHFIPVCVRITIGHVLKCRREKKNHHQPTDSQQLYTQIDNWLRLSVRLELRVVESRVCKPCSLLTIFIVDDMISAK